MLDFDVFNQDIFKAISMSAAVDRMDYVPDVLGQIPDLIVAEPVRTEAIWIEERATGFTVLPFSPRGTAPHQTGGDKRKARAFQTQRISDASRITASELQGIRAFGTNTELKQLMGEISRRQFKMGNNFELSWEQRRLGMVQGLAIDADGSIVYDWSQEFDQAQPAEVAFDLSPTAAPGSLKATCNKVSRSVTRGLKGIGKAKSVKAVVGDDFWDGLTTHAEVEKTYANWEAAVALRGEISQPWSAPFRFGGIDWINYRNTDDGAACAIAADRAKFFPVGAGIFRWAMSPGERFSQVNTLGQKVYSAIVMDKDRDSWADVEMYSYFLPVCVAPAALASGRKK